MIKQFYFKQFHLVVFLHTVKISNSSIQPIDRKLSGATTACDGNEGVLHILHSSSITGASPSDCLVSYTRTLVSGDVRGGVLPLCRDAVGIFNSPKPTGLFRIQYFYGIICSKYDCF